MGHDVADLPAAERERYFELQQVPPDLRAEVESLCRFDAHEGFLTDWVAESAAEFLRSDLAPTEGTACGPYRLIRLLGKGGMGTVFLAERSDGEVDRTVAINARRMELWRSWNRKLPRQLICAWSTGPLRVG